MATKLIRASGGIVERKDDDGVRIAVVRRKRRSRRCKGSNSGARARREWVLPKGKPDRAEKTKQTALREVREETGCAVKLKKGRKVKTKYSTVAGNDKVVTFFRMGFVKKAGPPDAAEIAKVRWLRPAAAAKRLTYGTERKIVKKMYLTASKG